MKALVLPIAIGLTAALVGCGADAGEPAAAESPYVIGAVAPLTGPAATVGVGILRPLSMWVEEVNEAGGVNGRKVELLTCNDEGAPARAVTCVRDFIAKDVLMIANFTLTGSVNAVLPLVKENGPVMIMASPNTAPDAKEYPYVFQTSPGDADLTQGLADYLTDSGASKLGMVAATDASSEVAVAHASEIFPKAGIEYKLERIDLNETNAGVQIAALASADVDAVYSNYTGAGAAAVAKSFADSALDVPLIVNYGNVSSAFVATIKNSIPPRLLGVALTGLLGDKLLKDEGEKKRTAEFVAKYSKEYGDKPDMLNMLGKHATDAIAATLANSEAVDRDSIKSYLESNEIQSLQNFAWSPTDHIALEAADVTVVELKEGQWDLAGPIE